MYILKLTYLVPLTEVDKYVQAHRDYLDYHYKQGLFLASGPLTPRTGGIVLTVKMPKDQLQMIIDNDPFNLAGVASFEILEFTPIKHCSQLEEVIQKTEGALC